MRGQEKILFFICMALHFLISIILIIKPEMFFKVYFRIVKVFGFEFQYSDKSKIIGRILGIILFFWGILVIWLSMS